MSIIEDLKEIKEERAKLNEKTKKARETLELMSEKVGEIKIIPVLTGENNEIVFSIGHGYNSLKIKVEDVNKLIEAMKRVLATYESGAGYAELKAEKNL